MARHYGHAFRKCIEQIGRTSWCRVNVGNVCAEGRWFGTKVGGVWLFYCLNSTSSFLFAIFNYYLIFPPIVPVLFSSDHKAFAGNVGDVRFASSVRGIQRCVLTVQLVLCCAVLS